MSKKLYCHMCGKVAMVLAEGSLFHSDGLVICKRCVPVIDITSKYQDSEETMTGKRSTLEELMDIFYKR